MIGSGAHSQGMRAKPTKQAPALFDWIVDLPYANGDITTLDGTVIAAPPIFRWMKGKGLGYCLQWVEKKGGTITPLDYEASSAD